MPIRVTCPHCRRDLRLPDELYDAPAQCPLCKGAFGVHWRSPVQQKSAAGTIAAPAAPAPTLRPCRSCGELIKAHAPRCPHCGVYQATE